MDYDVEQVDWNYIEEADATDRKTYNTILTGYSKVAHTSGDILSDESRKAVVEYQKTL